VAPPEVVEVAEVVDSLSVADADADADTNAPSTH
jgi:hypothetical protein